MSDKNRRQIVIDKCLDKGWFDMYQIRDLAFPGSTIKATSEIITSMINYPQDLKIEIKFAKRNGNRVRYVSITRDESMAKYGPTDPRRKMSKKMMLALGVQA